MSSSKQRLNITVDRRVKQKAKEKSKRLDTSLSKVCEKALKQFIEREESVKCSCGAKYYLEALQNGKIQDCKVCGNPL